VPDPDRASEFPLLSRGVTHQLCAQICPGDRTAGVLTQPSPFLVVLDRARGIANRPMIDPRAWIDDPGGGGEQAGNWHSPMLNEFF